MLIRCHTKRGRTGFGVIALLMVASTTTHATVVEATVSGGVVLTDVREYAGTGFGGETVHSVRLDLRVSPASNNFAYQVPTYPPGYSVSNVQKTATRQFSIDGAYVGSLTSNGAPVSGPALSITQTTPFEYRFPGPASRTITVNSFWTVTWDVSGPNNYFAHTGDSYEVKQTTVLTLTRQDVDMVSIDSRRVYGQPNLDGEIPADPNADLRNPSFKDWTYKGGLFVGVAAGNDQSGTARVQAWVTTATGGLMSSLTLRALGQPTNYGVPTLKVFAPSAGDPNLSTTPTTATWANKWDLSTASTLGEPTAVGTLPPNEYYRVKLLQVPTKIGIALSDETNGSGLWQYFASAAYETGYPLADSRPRLWTASGSTTDEIHDWQYWDGSAPAGMAALASLPKGHAISGLTVRKRAEGAEGVRR